MVAERATADSRHRALWWLCATLAFLVVATVADAQSLRWRRPGSDHAPRPAASDDATKGTEEAAATEETETQPYVPAPLLLPVPDRWRLVETLGVVHEHWWDPYNQSSLKADRPVFGKNWFFNLGLVSDTVFEGRRLPVGKGQQATDDGGDLDVFGNGDQLVIAENLIIETSLIQGNTTFRPPDWEIRIVGAANVNYLDAQEIGIVNIDPADGKTRTDGHFGFQELFVDKHLRNVSHYYDFDSLRVGIQRFTVDFRGFLFDDQQPGVRLFGTRMRNRLQYNLAWFRRLEKNTNSGLNSVFDFRADDVIVANVFYQDFPILGHTVQALAVYNRNREGDRAAHYNDNGFIERPASIGDERPHDYDVGYVGIGGDGHFGRFNLTSNAFFAFGQDDHNPIAQKKTDICAYLLAAEGSVDFDWARLKAFVYHASGDDDPFDSKAEGFDAIFENPNFAGADTSFWHRQAMPLVAGGGVVLSGRNALLPALRSSKEEGQSSFVNPGLLLIGVGGDFDILPQLRLTLNATRLDFDDTSVLRTVRQQRGVSTHIGHDLSAALTWRPWFIENVVVRASGAVLVPGAGMKDLYDNQYDAFYSTLMNVILTY